MSTDVQNPVEPSATVSAVADGWDENGRPIVTQKPEPPKKEESATSEAPTTQAKPEKHAEPGTAKPKPKPNAEERISQLTAERNSEREARAALEERIRKLESAAQPTPKVEPAKPKEPPKRPNPFTWKGTQEEFDAAMDEYEQYRDSQVAQRTRQEQAQEETRKAMQAMVKETAAKHPDAEGKIKAATSEIMTKAPGYIQAFVNDSEVLGELLYTLSDSTTLSNLLETAKTNPGKALRALRDMETDIQKALKTPETEPPKPKEEVSPEPKPRAPKPPTEVGGRGAATEDAAVAAAKDGNFGAFDAEQRRRYMRS